jgi:hypothetical protein
LSSELDDTVQETGDVVVTVSAATANASATHAATETVTREGGVETRITRLAGWVAAKTKRGPGRPRRNEERNREWAKWYRELDLELNDPDGLNGERPISKEGLAALVACEDFKTHPKRWAFNPEANALTRKRAAEKVKKAIKPLI